MTMTATTAAAESARPDTKTRLLEAAERLVALHGVEGVSVRDIAQEAGVGLAALNYHFGSKIGLVLAVIAQRGDEAWALRARRIEPFLAQDRIADLRGLLRALLEVHMIRPSAPGQPTEMFFARVLVDPNPEIDAAFTAGSADLTADIHLIRRALPDLPFEEACWRYYAILGMNHLNQVESKRMLAMSEGRCDPADRRQLFERMLDYAVAILTAPVAPSP